MLINALGSSVIPDGEYLYDNDAQKIESSGCKASAATKRRRRKRV